MHVQAEYFDVLIDAEPSASGGPSQKKRATSQRIFLAAIDLMRSSDFDNVSVEEICAKAEVARATFFKHFPNKAAIYGFALQAARLRIEAELISENGSAKDKLLMVVDHMERFSHALGPASAQMFAAFISQPGGGFQIHDPNSGIESILLEIVREGQASGEFSTAWPPEEIAVCIISGWVGAARFRITHGNGERKSGFGGVLSLLLKGFEKK